MDARERARTKRLWTLFRITPEEHSAILTYQQNHSTLRLLLGSWLGFDHNHRTGESRGLLDHRINRALGMIENTWKDATPQVLRALADYVENPPARKVLGAKRYGLTGKAKVKKKMVYGGPEFESATDKFFLSNV